MARSLLHGQDQVLAERPLLPIEPMILTCLGGSCTSSHALILMMNGNLDVAFSDVKLLSQVLNECHSVAVNLGFQ